MSQNFTTRDDLLDGMLGDFIDEADGLLHQLNDHLLTLDEWVKKLPPGRELKRRCDIDLLNEMFRAAHSIKGLSGMLRLDDINRLTHKMENVLDAARQGQLALRAEVVELVFQAVDRLGAMIERLKNGGGDDVDCDSVVAGIERVLRDCGAHREASVQADAEHALAAAEAAIAAAQMDPAHLAATSATDPLAGIVDETEVPANYMAMFIDEAEQSLDELSDILIGERYHQSVDQLLVTCHRIKGSAASLGLNRPAKLSHLMEDVLQELQQLRGEVSDAVAEGLLTCTDALRLYVTSLRDNRRDDASFGQAYSTLALARSVNVIPPQSSASPDPVVSTQIDDATVERIAAQAPAGAEGVIVFVQFERELPLVELKARLVYERAAALGQVFFSTPNETSLDEVATSHQLTLAILANRDEIAVQQQLLLEGVTEITVKSFRHVAPAVAPLIPLIDSTGEVEANGDSAESRSANRSKPVETLRVDIDRLDQLMNLAGQLVINKARFVQINNGLRPLTRLKGMSHALSEAFLLLDRMTGATGAKDSLATLRSHAEQLRGDLEIVRKEVSRLSEVRGLLSNLSEAVHQLDRVSDGIQKSVMDTRMVPIGPLFNRFRRVVRDLTRNIGKDVRLEIRGEKTELDKRMIDELGDPLIHMIRNSCDHGVESPEERTAAGKSPHGTVTLDAFHRGNRIVIQITDDGRGLRPDKIRAKAIAKGIITEADAEKMSQQQIFQLIWEPGFSTAEKVTEVSGRGMGMDIVRTKIEELSGTVELDSTPGVGTVFTIRLPLTMAILPSLLAQIDGGVFAVPVESVVEIIRVPRKELGTVHGMPTVQVRDRVISVVALRNLFDWNQAPRAANAGDGPDVTLVVMGADGREAGLVVHGLIGEQDIVIKSMAENYRNVEGVAGASILGDGRVALILDVPALMEIACRPRLQGDTSFAHSAKTLRELVNS